MTVETFTWTPQSGATAAVELRTLKAQFGDGYAQEAADGINARKQSWPLEFLGTKAEMEDISAFIDATGGYRSFLWTPPVGPQGYYRTKAYSLAHQSADEWKLTTTFIEFFRP